MMIAFYTKYKIYKISNKGSWTEKATIVAITKQFEKLENNNRRE